MKKAAVIVVLIVYGLILTALGISIVEFIVGIAS